MKKIQLLIVMMLAALAGACRSDLAEPVSVDDVQATILTATIESSSETRTFLSPPEDGVSRVCWSDGDGIGVFVDGSSSPSGFALTAGTGTRNGTFSGAVQGKNYVAVYPYSRDAVLDGQNVRIELPAEQDYVPSTFGNGAYPMVAVSSSSELPFKGVASVLKVSLKGHQDVTRIVFRTNDPAVKVSGPAVVSLADPSEPVLTMDAKGADSVVLNAGGVRLADDTATDFFFVLPAQTYRNGFTVRIWTSSGYMDKSYGTTFTMRRARLHSSTPVKVRLDQGVDPSTFLEGKGTEADPFLIGSLEDLVLFQSRVNLRDGKIPDKDGTEVPASGAHYLMTSDVDLGPVCGRGAGQSWVPVGDVASDNTLVFKGCFDGGGHSVTGLFIDRQADHQGFFGYLRGTVRNLTVSGSVSGNRYSGLLVGKTLLSVIDNCVTTGSVTTSGSCCGGIAGETVDTGITYCRNEAAISAGSAAGGIVGEDNYARDIQHCINLGRVSCRSTCGGIVARVYASKIIDCTNRGTITASSSTAGGIAGAVFYGGKVFNGVNYGTVSASSYAGGISGRMSSQNTKSQGAATIANCINLGPVKLSGSGNQYGGMLAGHTGLLEGESAGADTPATNAWVMNGYWLTDIAAGLPAVGGGTGLTESVFALTDAQLKGAAYGGVLYSDSYGSYSSLIDALNAGAFRWSENIFGTSGDSRTQFPLCAWEYPGAGTYPTQSDLAAHRPGETTPLFELTGDSFTFAVKGGSFQTEVTSSHDYSIGTLPGWITAGEVQTFENRPHTHIHSFTVAANTGDSQREAVISFSNALGSVLQVRVSQKAPYLTVSETTLACTAVGGPIPVSISSSLDWRITMPATGADWFQTSPVRGSGDATLSVTVAENTQSSARESAFTISSEDGSLVHTVRLIQSGKAEVAGDWETCPFYHQSLIMRFTATWCTWCPVMNNSLARARELYPGKIQTLALHSNSSELAFDPSGDLMVQYKSFSLPTGIVDGRIHISNNTDIEMTAERFVAACYETERTYGTASGLAIRSSCSGRQVLIDVDTYFKLAGSYKITVLLVEDGIVHYQANGGTNYVHDNVVRATATQIRGDAFTVGSDLTHKPFFYVVSVPEGYVMDNMRVVAYIQRSFGSAPRIQSDAYGDYYVDNCATAPLGGQVGLMLVNNGDSGGGNEEIIPGGEIQ